LKKPRTHRSSRSSNERSLEFDDDDEMEIAGVDGVNRAPDNRWDDECDTRMGGGAMGESREACASEAAEEEDAKVAVRDVRELVDAAPEWLSTPSRGVSTSTCITRLL
jgi:hypothetical protein